LIKIAKTPYLCRRCSANQAHKMPKHKQAIDATTHQKIKTAARMVFHQKGYAATRTRHIAEAAGINLALLNYYFKSKEQLFNLIMLETFTELVATIKEIVTNPNTSLHQKVSNLVATYIDQLLQEPQIPLFIVSEIRNNPQILVNTLQVPNIIFQSAFARQYAQSVQNGSIAPLPIMHFLMNLLGFTVFPFIAQPMLQTIGSLTPEQFTQMMQERKQLIPKWVAALLAP